MYNSSAVAPLKILHAKSLTAFPHDPQQLKPRDPYKQTAVRQSETLQISLITSSKKLQVSETNKVIVYRINLCMLGGENACSFMESDEITRKYLRENVLHLTHNTLP